MTWQHWFFTGLFGLAAFWIVVPYLGGTGSAPSTDRPVNIPASGSHLRLSFVGTSLTASYDWTERLQSCTGPEVSVSRVARAGATSAWGLTQAETILSHQPDIVFIEFSINDADMRHGISLRESAENHRQLILALRAQHQELQVVLMTMSPAYGIRRLLRPRLPAYYRLYHELAEELGTGLLDLYPRWLNLPKQDREQPDGLHPTGPASSRVILSELPKYLGITCLIEK